jgi:hypothetical protein
MGFDDGITMALILLLPLAVLFAAVELGLRCQVQRSHKYLFLRHIGESDHALYLISVGVRPFEEPRTLDSQVQQETSNVLREKLNLLPTNRRSLCHTRVAVGILLRRI